MVDLEIRLPYCSVNHLNEEIDTPFLYEGREYIEGSSRPLPCILGEIDFGNNASAGILNIKKLTGTDFKLLRSTHLTALVTVRMLSEQSMKLLREMKNPTVHYVYIVGGRTREIHAAFIADKK